MDFRYADDEDVADVGRIVRSAYAVEIGSAGEAFRADTGDSCIVSDGDVLENAGRWLLGEREAEGGDPGGDDVIVSCSYMELEQLVSGADTSWRAPWG